MAKINRDKM